MLLATWQLIACSHGIVVLLFCDPTPLTRLCNNPPSRGVQLLLNLLSNLPGLLMRYLPKSVRSLLISQRNLPNRLLSLGNLRMLFSSLRTRRLYYLHSSPRYLVTQPSQQFPNLLVWTLKLYLLHNGLRGLLISHHIFPPIHLYSPIMFPIHVLRKPSCLPCSSQNLHNSPQVVFSHFLSFLLLLRKPECHVIPILACPRHLARFRLL